MSWRTYFKKHYLHKILLTKSSLLQKIQVSSLQKPMYKLLYTFIAGHNDSNNPRGQICSHIFTVGNTNLLRYQGCGTRCHWWGEPNINVLMLHDMLQFVNFMLHFMVTLFKICVLCLVPPMADVTSLITFDVKECQPQNPYANVLPMWQNKNHLWPHRSTKS